MKSQVVLSACAALMAGCGGGGSLTASATPDPGGLYASGAAGGYFSSPGAVRDDLIVIIDSNGKGAMLLLPNGSTQLVASSIYRFESPRERSFTRSFREYARPGTSFSPGVTARNGTLNADLSVDERTLDGTLTATGASSSAVFLVDYVSLHDVPAPFSISQGSYVYSIPTTGAAVSVDFMLNARGEIDGRDTAGCTHSGSLSIPDARFDVYNLSLTRDCGPSAVTNYTGLAYFLPAVAADPAYLVLAYDDGANFGLGTAAERQ